MLCTLRQRWGLPWVTLDSCYDNQGVLVFSLCTPVIYISDYDGGSAQNCSLESANPIFSPQERHICLVLRKFILQIDKHYLAFSVVKIAAHSPCSICFGCTILIIFNGLYSTELCSRKYLFLWQEVWAHNWKPLVEKEWSLKSQN
jgi:hypothetical protein